MGMMDDVKDKFGDMDKMRARYEELKQKEQAGELDDMGRQELSELRSKFE